MDDHNLEEAMSESVEMYLLRIALLQDEDRPVPISALAEELAVSPVSANQMCRKLEERGMVHYEPYKGPIQQRLNGVLISQGNGAAVPFAIDGLQQRGIFFVNPGEECYEGMIVAEHCLDKDLVVNMQKTKQLTNVRASGTDRAMKNAPAQVKSLEEALEYIAEDELVEITPHYIRMRKKLLTENDRKRAGRQKSNA
jgi:predicted membrane GTPase involved in stress response